MIIFLKKKKKKKIQYKNLKNRVCSPKKYKGTLLYITVLKKNVKESCFLSLFSHTLSQSNHYYVYCVILQTTYTLTLGELIEQICFSGILVHRKA